MQTDIKVREIQTYLTRARCRTPLSFGAVIVEEIPLGYARAVVENRAGRIAEGWGAMFLMDLWAWPVSQADHEAKRDAMCRLFDAYARSLSTTKEYGHPLELFMQSEERLAELAGDVTDQLTPGEKMPFLAMLGAASPIDHALYDAFGNVNDIDAYRACGPEHMSFDLSRYLGKRFKDIYPAQFLRQNFLAEIPVFHLVGGVDLLRESEVTGDLPKDGIPNSLEKWIERDGVFCLKVKLKGRDLSWDISRTLEAAQVYHDVQKKQRPDIRPRPFLTVDFNEQCETTEYVVEYLTMLRKQSQQTYDDLLYIEQPVDRDLEAHKWDMSPISQLKPVIIDESLTRAEDLELARRGSWSGIALKSCKCLSSDLLLIAAAEMEGIPYAVQDLTNPSLALIESIGLAARIHPIKGVEANSRQFFPQANDLITAAHPEIVRVNNGFARTTSLRGPGLGFKITQIPNFRQAIEAADNEYRSV